jgi:hypothetical protein
MVTTFGCVSFAAMLASSRKRRVNSAMSPPPLMRGFRILMAQGRFMPTCCP